MGNKEVLHDLMLRIIDQVWPTYHYDEFDRYAERLINGQCMDCGHQLTIVNGEQMSTYHFVCYECKNVVEVTIGDLDEWKAFGNAESILRIYVEKVLNVRSPEI